MKKLLPLLLLICSVSAFGQATIDELKAKAKKAKLDGEMHFGYDKFRDQGFVISKPRNIVGDWEGVGAIMSSGGYGRSGVARVIMVAIESRFAGKQLAETPNKFLLVFDTMNAEHMFLKGSRKLYMLFDNERLELDALGHDSDVKGGFMSGPRVEEKLVYELTRDQVEQIAKAAKVEVMIGGNEKARQIKANALKGWRAVLEITKL